MKSIGKIFNVQTAILIGSIIIGLAILVSGGIIKPQILKTETNQAVALPAPSISQAPKQEVKTEPVSTADHLRGSRGARIVLIEYSDLECPFCKRFHETAKKVVDEYGGQVAWVYRHFPLDQLHSKARKEAEATECAFELGAEEGFWKLTDKIFEVTPSNNGLELNDLPLLASQVGLDEAKFKTCLDSGKYKDKIEQVYQSGIKSSVQGTPATFILDTKTGKQEFISGAVPFDNLKQTIDKLLQS